MRGRQVESLFGFIGRMEGSHGREHGELSRLAPAAPPVRQRDHSPTSQMVRRQAHRRDECLSQYFPARVKRFLHQSATAVMATVASRISISSITGVEPSTIPMSVLIWNAMAMPYLG